MLVNLWYVAEWSKAVREEPVQVKMLGQNFVLYRDNTGKAHCLSDVCLHRGGSLSGGCNKGDSIACPYHGWRFNGDGCVTLIPSEGEDFRPPDRARIDAYPVRELYGMIWVFLGDAPEQARFPLPELPEYEDPAWKAITDQWVWKAEAARVVENGIDIAHASFVHPVFGMEATARENHIVSLEKNEYHGSSENLQYPPAFKDGGFIRRRMRGERQPTVTKPEWHLNGMTVRIQIDINPKMSIIMLMPIRRLMKTPRAPLPPSSATFSSTISLTGVRVNDCARFLPRIRPSLSGPHPITCPSGCCMKCPSRTTNL